MRKQAKRKRPRGEPGPPTLGNDRAEGWTPPDTQLTTHTLALETRVCGRGRAWEPPAGRTWGVCLHSPPKQRSEKHPDGVTLQEGRGEATQRLQRACGAPGFFKGCFLKLNGRYVLISFISTL